MGLLGDVGDVESRSVCLEMVLVLIEDWCTVCAKRIIGSDIALDAPNGTPRLTQDQCTVCVERTIGSETVLDAPVGTPR